MNICKFDGCERPKFARQMCNMHYRRDQYGVRPMNDRLSPKRYERGECSVPGCSRSRITNGWCRACNDRWRRNGGPLGPVTSKYSCVDSDGYERWNLCHPQNVWGQQVYGHRAVMELYLGRPLLPDENVHHINGERSDNRIENLELWNTSQPQGQRVQDKVTWAKEILSIYATI